MPGGWGEGRKPALARWMTAVDKVCDRLNPLLVVVVIGLVILNVSCYAALELRRWRPPVPERAQPAAPLPAARF